MKIIHAIYQHFSTHPKHRFTNKNKKLSDYEIGDWTYGNPTVLSWGEGATLKISHFCLIAKGVPLFLGGEHCKDWVLLIYSVNFLKQQRRI